VEAGALDRRVQLLRATVTQDDANEDVYTWPLLAEVSASRQDVSDGERVRAQQVGASLTTRFQIRWSPEVDSLSPVDRLRCEGRTYDITGVKAIGRRDALEITANARPEPVVT